MQITTTTTKKGRINVHADGEYLFTVPAFVWYRSPLCGQSEAAEEELAALLEEAREHEAYEKALRLLGMRAHSEAELGRKLARDYPKSAVQAALTRLNEAGLINDAAFAEQLAEELARRKNYAPQRIQTELARRGVPAEIAKNAANALDIDKKQGIIDIIAKMHLPERPAQKDVNRLIRRLLNAGYTMREIRETVTFSEEAPFDDC